MFARDWHDSNSVERQGLGLCNSSVQFWEAVSASQRRLRGSAEEDYQFSRPSMLDSRWIYDFRLFVFRIVCL